MNPPASGSGDGGEDAASATQRSSSINQMAFCHECGIEIRPLMTPDPTCPRCNGQFVEIIDENSAADGMSFALETDEDDEIPLPGHFASLSSVQGGGLLNHLLTAMATGRAAQRSPHTPGSSDSNPRTATAADSPGRNQSPYTTTRSGTTSFGPFGLQWNVQYGSGGGDPYQRAAEQQAEQDQRQQQNSNLQSPPTLSNFLRFAFGGADSTDDPATRPDTYFHEDGMGGAGGVADGRHFNHDNRGTFHQPDRSNDPSSRDSGTNAGSPNNDLPPELSALRNLFTSLFGEPGAQGGSLLDVLAAGAQGGGPRGQWGDYVLGQQGLDDIISQLMEQTQGSTAPPPATEDVIEKLERFTLEDKQRIQKARNQDCPTCKDDFLPSSEANKQDGSGEKGEDADEQQQDLISMPCGHIFHVDCLVPWLRMHGTCPVCRISIVKPTEGQEEQSSSNTTTQQPQGSSGGNASDASAARATAIPGGWPSPPNPFASSFNHNMHQGVQVPRDSPEVSTMTIHPQPATSTTVTSTTYPAHVIGTPSTTGATGPAGIVINSIMSSPPIVSDREEFFAEPPSMDESQQQAHSGIREDMRETLRRAAEDRARNAGAQADGSTGGAGQRQRQRQRQPWLEPDELD